MTVLMYVQVDKKVLPVLDFIPGYKAGIKSLFDFINAEAGSGLRAFASKRNDPTRPDCLSNLSPYLHFGQISAQRCALIAKTKKKSSAYKEGVDAYMEELIIRRELSDNFCYHCEDYDNIAGAKSWARKTLDDHRNDKREYLYELKDFERAKTHDLLWNAAQLQMVIEGKMHGYMRMYWAKKILEWSKSPEEAIHIAIFLNDKYSIDGKDPNGYVGVMWSICGTHDRAFAERKISGKIRCMTFDGCRRKFNVQAFIDEYSGIET